MLLSKLTASMQRLAHLLRAGMLAESYVPEGEIRELRDLVRTRKSLIEERTAEKNRVRAVFKRTDNTYSGELFGPTGREFLAELSLNPADRTIVEAHLSVIDELNEQIEELEELIEQHVLESPAAQLLWRFQVLARRRQLWLSQNWVRLIGSVVTRRS